MTEVTIGGVITRSGRSVCASRGRSDLHAVTAEPEFVNDGGDKGVKFLCDDISIRASAHLLALEINNVEKEWIH